MSTSDAEKVTEAIIRAMLCPEDDPELTIADLRAELMKILTEAES